MTLPPFVARTRELALLERLWRSPRAELLILYGRRRVGKTRLLTHWMSAAAGRRALYWVAEPTSSVEQLRSFSQALYNFENPAPTAPDPFSYASWTQAWQQVARLAQNERLALALDEFTYLLAVEPGMAGVLQNAWDHTLKQSGLLLAVSGSHIGMMERQVLAYQAPLYGRATASLRLPPLPFSATRQYFPAYPPGERVALYAMLGGIPAYWEQFDPAASLEDNLRSRFLEGANLLQDEPRLLLSDFVSELHNYAAILRAIACGYRTPKEIAGAAGLNERHISMYLSNLVETGFVARRLPVTERGPSRQGRHVITDPFLRFYFRFLSRRQAQLALGVPGQALAELQRHLPDFIGAHTWEELCQEWLLQAGVGGRGGLPFLPDEVGSAWNKAAQVDVVGVNFMENTLLLGECKWERSPTGRQALAELVDKTARIIPAGRRWTVFFLGFARQGWTDEANRFAAAAAGLNGENWQSAGMRLLDLPEVDQDLARWEVEDGSAPPEN